MVELNAFKSIPVAVLGATGSVGQRFVQLLDRHPWFRIEGLAASDRSAGQIYAHACRWILPEPMPEAAAGLVVQSIEPNVTAASGVRLVFSALPTDLARQVEPEFARAGIAVCSNASAYRKEPDVPLLLPEVNPEHVTLVKAQRQRCNWQGCIVTNPNCTSTGLTIALKVLQDAFGLRKAFVVSLQALSGAGYPGVPSMDVLDNVLPNIAGEETKVEWEPRKMLGKMNGGAVELADFLVSAHTNRVAVSDGHLVCVSVELENPAGIDSAAHAFRSYQAPSTSMDLPSAPKPVILLRDEEDRPQPRLDRMTGQGMTTIVGRLRSDPIFHLKFVILSHNTIRGAAGGSIYNAELLVQQELI